MEQTNNYISKLGVPAFFYAIFSTFCLYDNFSGITMLLFIGATIYFCHVIWKNFSLSPKSDNYIYHTFMLLFAISSFLTGNTFFITCNFLCILFLIICLLLHNFYDDKSWNFQMYLSSIILSIMGSIGSLSAPLMDIKMYHQDNKNAKNRNLLYITIGFAISVPFLFIVTMLLTSADIIFSSFVKHIFEDIFHVKTFIGLILFFIVSFLVTYCSIHYMSERKCNPKHLINKSYEPVIAITMLLLISFVYIIFSFIQIVYLFFGKFTLPSGYSYATYAREGFFQLLAVCIINVLLVLLIQTLFKNHKFLKLLLTIISLCTYIMMLSSAMRMLLYIKAYNLTFLRILVLWTLAVLALFLIGILAQIYKMDFPLFRYGMLLFCSCYLLLSFSHVDYFIAKYNIYHFTDDVSMDAYYLSTLSTDAAPIINKADNLVGDSFIKEDFIYYNEKYLDSKIRKFNLSHFIANQLFASDLKDAKHSLHIMMTNTLADNIIPISYTIYDDESFKEIKNLPFSYVESNHTYDISIDLTTIDQKVIDKDMLYITFTFKTKDGELHTSDSCWISPSSDHIHYLSLSCDNEADPQIYYIYLTHSN